MKRSLLIAIGFVLMFGPQSPAKEVPLYPKSPLGGTFVFKNKEEAFVRIIQVDKEGNVKTLRPQVGAGANDIMSGTLEKKGSEYIFKPNEMGLGAYDRQRRNVDSKVIKAFDKIKSEGLPFKFDRKTKALSPQLKGELKPLGEFYFKGEFYGFDSSKMKEVEASIAEFQRALAEGYKIVGVDLPEGEVHQKTKIFIEQLKEGNIIRCSTPGAPMGSSIGDLDNIAAYLGDVDQRIILVKFPMEGDKIVGPPEGLMTFTINEELGKQGQICYEADVGDGKKARIFVDPDSQSDKVPKTAKEAIGEVGGR